MKRSLWSFSMVGLTLLLSSGIAWAQATAQLNGRVTDESGAVLPGVTVTAAQTDTGFTRTTVTDETGAWVMPNVPIGPYRLEISLQGFRAYVQTGIVLQVNASPVITVDDPKVLARPWTSAVRTWTLVEGQDVKEFYCTNNPDLEEFQKLIDAGK